MSRREFNSIVLLCTLLAGICYGLAWYFEPPNLSLPFSYTFFAGGGGGLVGQLISLLWLRNRLIAKECP